ncbi:hypothetical protein DJ568_06965 [Mucilaginibacter hurinus]|uniref:Alpha glucuronidase N-terminal domain-containing protein n=1 Tax=Mucilaginibacter hurinus TaxID=2201324 RepID=A0A367GQ88_9SPHI|nr:DUF4838 domain-containing protein [Mucilaginibacter hurinus]RCH55622.1 hypothetical protein DJ568_06965 [Mucilaginibacter hurinus]
MKMFFNLCFTVIFTLSSFFSRAADVPVILVKANKSQWKIHTVSATKEAKFAAGELQKYLQKISGATLPAAKAPGNYSIIIGLKKDIPAAYQKILPVMDKGYDAYTVAVSAKPDVVVVAGENGQGIIYGVYDLLEKIGCRWFYPRQDSNDPEVVPSLSTVSINSSSWMVSSPTRYRIYNGDGWFFKMDYELAKEQVDWAMKNRYNAVGWQALASNANVSLFDQYDDFKKHGVETELDKRGMFIHGPAHSFDQLLNHDVYFKDHPEWFGLRDGKRVPQTYAGAQFCWSNQDARKEFTKNAIAFIEKAPLIKIFSNIPFDGGVPCACDICKKAGASNLLMVVASELAEELKTTHPDVMVETIGGYGAVPDPPTNLDVINERLRIIWAQWGRYHGVGYDDPAYDAKNLDNWRKAAKGGLSICQYYPDNFAEPWVMGPFTKAMVSDRRYFIKHNVSAMYMLTYPKGYWWNHGLNAYLGGRTYYDKTYDPYEAIRDYGLKYYGPQAGPYIADYYQEWATNIDLSYHVRDDTNNEDRKMLADEQKKFIEPAIAAAKGNKSYAYRVNRVAKLHALAMNMAEGHRLRGVIETLRKNSKFDDAAKVLEKAKVHTDGIMANFYALADMNQGLIERAEVGGFIKIGIKGWLDEEQKRIAAHDTTPLNPYKKLSETEMLPADVLK